MGCRGIKALAALAVLAGFVLLAQSGAAATDSGLYVDVRANESANAPVVERFKLYGASHALVIGIDAYTKGWPRLRQAVADAKAVAKALEERGFDVQLVTNPDSATLAPTLKRFFAIKGADPEARLFVWYAGHGHTEFGEGYLVPADAPAPEDPEFLIKALHLGDVASMVRIARAKHVLSVFDACFAGTIFTAQRARPPASIARATVKPVRQFLTSGDADQTVSDDGMFRKLFLRALTGEERGDLNGDGYLTGSELSFFLEDRVTNLTQATQTPRGGKLRDPRFDLGDFVFKVPVSAGAAGQTQTAAVDPRSVELTYWESIKNTQNQRGFRSYLGRYPNGMFADLARIKLQELGGGAIAGGDQAASPPPQSAALTPSEMEGRWTAKYSWWTAEIDIKDGNYVLKVACQGWAKIAKGQIGADGKIRAYVGSRRILVSGTLKLLKVSPIDECGSAKFTFKRVG